MYIMTLTSHVDLQVLGNLTLKRTDNGQPQPPFRACSPFSVLFLLSHELLRFKAIE